MEGAGALGVPMVHVPKHVVTVIKPGQEHVIMLYLADMLVQGLQ